jgi:Na+/H+ antiporter NhaA
MALFIAGLALKDESLRSAKVGVLVGSFLCAVIGMAILYRATPAPQPIPEE